MQTTAAPTTRPTLFDQLLPPAHLSLLIGDPGVGKSLLAINLAALLSHATCPVADSTLTPQIENQKSKIKNDAPASSILLSREDSISTLSARLDNEHADRSFTHLPVDSLDLLPRKKTVPSLIEYLLRHLPAIQNPRLLILDPLPPFLGTHDDNLSIRKLLHPLLDIAECYNLSILAISHLNKSNNKSPLHRSLGSLAFTALARTVLLLTKLPPNPDLNRHLNLNLPSTPHSEPSTQHAANLLLTPIKNNLHPITHAFPLTLTSTIHWHPNPIPIDPCNNPLQPPKQSPSQQFESSQLDFAIQFLETTLQHGPLPSADLLSEARALGISQRTLARARTALNILSFHHGPTGKWLCALPSQTTPHNPTTPAA